MNEPKRFNIVGQIDFKDETPNGEYIHADDPVLASWKRKAGEAKDWQDALRACEEELAKVREELRETKKVADLLQQSANRGLMGYHDVNNTAVDLNDGIDTSVKI